MNRFLLLLVLVLSACGGGGGGQSEERSEASPLPVYVLLGQSNMTGIRSEAKDLPAHLQATQPDTLFFKGGQWVALAPGVSEAQGFGPEISFGYQMPDTIGIVKVSKGGSSLAGHWVPGGDMFGQAVDAILAAKASRSVEFRGILWMQGESDALTQADADAYGVNLRATVSALRARVGDVRVTACRVNPPLADFPFAETVRAWQMYAGISDYHWIDCDGLSKVDDDLHYDTAGQVTLGEGFAAAVQR